VLRWCSGSRKLKKKGLQMLKEFRDFAMRGNVVDLAVGVIIGAAFGSIVTSLVGDIIMPVIGAITGGLDFSNYFTGLSKAVTATNLADAKKQGAVLAWGNFLTLTLNFVIVAFVLFLVIRGLNRLKRKDEAAPPPPKPTRQEELLTEIRDLLKKT
jgi:large conductance mechanosensitive channel